MKYFQVEQPDGQEPMLFTRVTALRGYLREHPEVKGARRYWFCRGDLVECVAVSRADILGKTARELTSGETAQWAARHGRV